MNLQAFINRPILSGVLSVFVVLLGVIGLVQLPVEQFPEIAPPTVRVSATYTGANAETLQKAVVAPLEEAINGVENINYMTSSATNNGTATINVYFRQDTDPDMAAVNVQNRIASAQGVLPAEVIRSGITVRKSQNSTAKIVALYSPDNSFDQKFLYNYFKINIEPRLARIPGVGDITVFGSDYSLRIWMDAEKMTSYGLVPADITAVLDEQNVEAPTGTLGADMDNTFQYVLKYRGRYEDEEDFGNLVIKSLSDGSVLRLKDVAEVELGALNYATKNELIGHPGTNCMIAQAPGSNANEIVEAIDEVIRDAAAELPKGMELVDLMSIKSFLDASVHNVIETLMEAILLVIFIVWLFLRNLRSTVIPAVAIVVSLIGTFAFLYFAGMSVNMLTLFALVLVIGTVVDDAIVVVEAVQSRFDSGCRSPRQATVEAMQGISRPLVTTSLVFMAVFIPVCFIGGATGKFYTQFGLTMAVAVLISTFNALTFSPALCVLLMKPTSVMKKTSRFVAAYDAAFQGMTRKYKSSVVFLLRRKWFSATLLAATCGFFYLLNVTKTGLVPDEDTGTIVVDVQAAPGTSLAQTERILKNIEDRIKDTPQFQIYSKSIGMGMLAGQGPSNGTFIIRLKPWDQRTGRHDDNRSVIDNLYRRLADITDARIMIFAQPIIAGYGVTNGFEVHVQDRRGSSVEELQRHAQAFIAALNERPEIARAQTSFDSRYPQYRVEVDAAVCKRAGVSPSEVLNALSGYIGGVYSSNINRFSKLYRVMMQASPEYRADVRSLDGLFVRTASGEMSPISRYVTLTRVYGSESLSRFNLFPSIAVNGAPAAGYSSGQALNAIREVAAQTLPAGYGYEFGAMSREEASAGNTSVWVFGICIVFIYLILCALYESLLIPLVVILAIPFGLFGSFLFAKLFGIENNIYMQTGIIMLIGLLAKTAILQTEYASECRSRGMSITASAVAAAVARLRPILMTSLTMIFGLLPMIFSTGVGCNGSRSLAVGTIGGMLVGTVSLLLFVPLLFIVFRHVEEKMIPGNKVQKHIQ
ncbi:efflux RND transporter permease subunit [Bacteroides sp. HF-5092]|uniref:efflux RND transporter permease subunit n=1 Tax=Bacteroides TaxID=816 RepID=UPI0011780A94|nr:MULTISPECIES: efflux RND transporter permease subunit [Bacteroides]TRX42098.1 efflux RND transporter permease subunit [Bacteroides sp. HF-5092]